MRVGDYVRTKDGRVGKIIDINLGDFQTRYELDNSDEFHYEYENDIIKSSPIIIDLIEVGDYVNGYKVSDIYEDINGQVRMKFGGNGLVLAHKSNYDNYYLFEKEIKSIVTKEHFENCMYKVGD